jgi:hypothetical protein
MKLGDIKGEVEATGAAVAGSYNLKVAKKV